MRLCLIALGALVLATGCRDFALPPERESLRFPLGIDCDTDAECQSGACVDGYCCEEVCRSDHACNLPDHQGRCQPRPPGSACSRGAQCPDGLCLHTRNGAGDPVAYCCNRRCADHERCDLPGHEGVCTARPPGDACAMPSQCPGGWCVLTRGGELVAPSGFCCEKACAPEERCDLPGAVGRCAARPVGDPCAGGEQCPTGACVDGVCCESACEGDCLTCALPGSVGRCRPVPDNQDLRGSCGQCGACQAGFCGAAEAGTDPKEDCPGSEVCSPSQRCGLPGGAPCGEDAQCAAGTCVLGRCFRLESEPVFAYPMDPEPYLLFLGGLDVSPSGEIAVGVRSTSGYQTVSSSGYSTLTLEGAEYLSLVRRPSGWVTASVTPFGLDYYDYLLLGSLAFWNDRLYQATFQPCPTPGSCGVGGQLLSRDLQAGQRETILEAGTSVDYLDLFADASQRLWVVTGTQQSRWDPTWTRRVHRRDAQPDGPPTWTEVFSETSPGVGWDFSPQGSRLVAATVQAAPLRIVLTDVPSGAPIDSFEVPATGNCDEPYLEVDPYGRGTGEGLLLLLECNAFTAFVAWTPAAPATERWTASLAPGAALRAVPVRNSEVPAFAYRTNWYVKLTWRPAPGAQWATAVVFESTSRATALDLSAVADAGGAPLVLVSTYSARDQTTGSVAATDLVLLRYRP